MKRIGDLIDRTIGDRRLETQGVDVMQIKREKKNHGDLAGL